MPTTRFSLTSEQGAAACSRAERLYINAAPGSGKTTVAAERFGLQRWERGADARRILGLSFTRSASAELAGRIRRRWGEVALHWPHAVMTIDALHCENVVDPTRDFTFEPASTIITYDPELLPLQNTVDNGSSVLTYSLPVGASIRAGAALDRSRWTVTASKHSEGWSRSGSQSCSCR